MNQIEIGKTELELSEPLSAYGQPVSVQTICATGERFTDAVVAPRNKRTALGDRFSVTMGLKGGLTSRAAYVAASEADLPKKEQDYLEKSAKPYFAALAVWYSTIGLDITAGELYDVVERVLPKQQYGWTLNPGHLTSSEEWAVFAGVFRLADQIEKRNDVSGGYYSSDTRVWTCRSGRWSCVGGCRTEEANQRTVSGSMETYLSEKVIYAGSTWYLSERRSTATV